MGTADYGPYECMARNEMGEHKEIVKLDVTSPPDVPLNLTVLNVTHSTVTIQFVPGFDGGLKASYRIRYRESDNDLYKYEDVPSNVQKMIINGLKENTVYQFSIMATNALGNSRYMPDLTKARTKGKHLSTVSFFSLLSIVH